MNNLPTVSAVVVAFGLTALIGFWLIPLLRKVKYGQTILDIGPNWHKKKQGTPTMGGLMFIVGIVVAVAVAAVQAPEIFAAGAFDAGGARLLVGVVMALAFGAVGFMDDYIKVVRKRNLGLSARQKLVMQFIIGALYLAAMYMAGERSTTVFVPFLGQWKLGLFYYPAALVGIVYIVNVVNITDGIDGLCSSVTFISALGFMVLAGVMQIAGMGILAGAAAGGCLGFLVWNLYPAKVFMGDTGSLFLGGIVIALAFGLGIPVFLIFMGIIYIIEGLSVMIQTLYFKYTRRKQGEGKRLFRMSPIHHHYEMGGWSESRIVIVFSVLQLIFCVLALLAVRQI